MGANSSTHTAPSKSAHPMEESDAPPPSSLVPPSRRQAPSSRQRYLLSLDRSMKAFLRASNLPGLEYRLRLAGYHTFHDLLSADQQTLEARGFTGIMSQRLLRAMSEYIRRQLSRSEEERLPFRLVRRGQRIRTEPSESMRENPNYQKRNVKRQKSSGGEEPGRKMATAWSPVASAQIIPSQVRLMAESDLELQHLISLPPTETVVTAESEDLAVETPSTRNMEEECSTTVVTGNDVGRDSLSPPADNRGQKILGVVVKDDNALLIVEEVSSAEGEDLPFSELDDAQLREEALLSLTQLRCQPLTGAVPSLDNGTEETDYHSPLPTLPQQIQRCFSVPADLKFLAQNSQESVFISLRMRAFSCTISPQPTSSHPCNQSTTI